MESFQHTRIKNCVHTLILMFFLAIFFFTPLYAANSVRLAVVDFDSQGEEAKKKEMGKVVAQLLTAAFVQADRFEVVERQALKKVVEEQKLAMTGLVDVDTAAQVGRVLGAKYIVTGTVVSYDGGIDLIAKIVEAESATIRVADRLTAGNISTLFQKISPFVSKLLTHFPVQGLVIRKSDKAVTLDVGGRNGVKPGMKFEVYKKGDAITHPISGAVLGVEKIKTGMIQVTKVQEKLAFAEIVTENPGQSISLGQQIESIPQTLAKRKGTPLFSAGLIKKKGPLQHDLTWGHSGTASGELYVPFGISADDKGTVYVADTYNNRIQVFDNKGAFQKAWGKKGVATGDFYVPYDVDIDRDGNVYVADTYNFRVQKFDSLGRFLVSWGTKGKGNGEFAFLSGIAIGPDNAVYTVDAKMHRVQVFDSLGKYLRSWGRKGREHGNFAAPMGIDVDSEGNVYVADSKMRRVQVFDSQGNFLSLIEGNLIYPTDVAVDSASGYLYVLDGKGCNVWEMSLAGGDKKSLGGPGTGTAQFAKPYGICVDRGGNVFVADSKNSRVQKLSH